MTLWFDRDFCLFFSPAREFYVENDDSSGENLVANIEERPPGAQQTVLQDDKKACHAKGLSSTSGLNQQFGERESEDRRGKKSYQVRLVFLVES